MKGSQAIRTVLLFAAALLMGFSAFVNATISVPHLREDMLEINVRPTLMGAIMLGLHFATFAMFGFTCIILVSAVESLRRDIPGRLPISIIALLYLGFGVAAFVLTGSHHMLGYVLIGLLASVAVAIRSPHQSPGTR